MHGYVLRHLPEHALDAILRLSRTRTNYWLEFVLDSALGFTLLAGGLHRLGPTWLAVALLGLGLLVFSFIEYAFHRWLFHGSLRLMAQGHGAHHLAPTGYDSLPCFLPAMVLLGLTSMLALLLPLAQTLLLASGIAFGYVAYGLSHFLIHHLRFRRPVLRKWAAYHHIHHYHPDRNFGVTTALWDVLLGTRYDASRGTVRPQFRV